MTDLRLGAVAVHRETGERGVVVTANGRGLTMLDPWPTRWVIQKSPGITVHTHNADGEWEMLADEAATTVERVLGAHAAWEPPTWYEDGERVSDIDSYEWALLRAMFTPAEADRVFPEHGDWPVTTHQLAIMLAHALDDRRLRDRSVGSALARLGR